MDDDRSEEIEQLRDEAWDRPGRGRGPLDRLIAWLLFLFLITYMSFRLWQDKQTGGPEIHTQRVSRSHGRR